MRDPATYRAARRSTAKSNLHWKRGLANFADPNRPQPTWRTIWPNYCLADTRLPRKARRP